MGLCRMLVLVFCVGLAAEGAPWRNYENQSQACGDKLADLLNLVCSGRGYNMAFRPEGSSARRVRRGIVDECCHRSCSLALLELYCRADPTEGPTNVQIRKRSDIAVQSTEYSDGPQTTIEHTTHKYVQLKHNTPKTQPTLDTTDRQQETTQQHNNKNYKLLNLITSMEHKKHHDTQNDTSEHSSQEHVVLRHHKHHRHSLLRHKALVKAHKAKTESRDSSPSFQIGTVKPYFAGRALVSHR